MDAPDISPSERARIAEAVNLNAQYLYQCMTGRAELDATKAVRVERASGQRIRRWHLRRDWFDTWPELVGTAGAPEIPGAQAGVS